jgi:hypothetical protein
MCVFLSLCLPACLSVCVCLSVGGYLGLCLFLSVCVRARAPVCLSGCLAVWMDGWMDGSRHADSGGLPRLSLCRSVTLSMSLSLTRTCRAGAGRRGVGHREHDGSVRSAQSSRAVDPRTASCAGRARLGGCGTRAEHPWYSECCSGPGAGRAGVGRDRGRPGARTGTNRARADSQTRSGERSPRGATLRTVQVWEDLLCTAVVGLPSAMPLSASCSLSLGCSLLGSAQEETGKTAQYLIVPEKHSAEDLVTNVARFMRAPDAANDDITEQSEDSRICKPSILFEVRARGMSYMDEAQDVIKNDYLRKQWFGGPEESRTTSRGNDVISDDDEDQMVRKFCDRTLDVFKDVVKGVANADGWFMNSAGRGAPHQLIGDCIQTYDALETTTWLNFASLDNPDLFAAKKGAGQVRENSETGEREELHGEDLHSYLVKELRKGSVDIPKTAEEGEKEIRLPKEPEAVTYVAPKTPFPRLADLQGSKGSDSLMQWLEKQTKALGEKKEMHMHPESTHFIFFVRAHYLLTHGVSTSPD